MQIVYSDIWSVLYTYLTINYSGVLATVGLTSPPVTSMPSNMNGVIVHPARSNKSMVPVFSNYADYSTVNRHQRDCSML